LESEKVTCLYLLLHYSFPLAVGITFTAYQKSLTVTAFELSNGVTVTLANVGKSPENIKILERYLRGEYFALR
jgi:hypothetical protein